MNQKLLNFKTVSILCAVATWAFASGCNTDVLDLDSMVDTDNQIPLNCGDGALDPDEECDDGLENSDVQEDACRLNCQVASCGDGVIDSNETCDDGNDSNTDDCVAGCVPSFCGDGFVHADLEQCDAGDENSDTTPDACRTDCTLPVCGDGVVDSAEQCDVGMENSDTEPDTCRIDCSSPSCGDSVVDTGEKCDDGNTDDEDGCNSLCDEVTFVVGPFTADYYNNDTFVYSEQVVRPAIDYPWDDFHNIVSENFHAIWTGTLEVVSEESQVIDINFDRSWASVTLTIDGILVESSGASRVSHDFIPGTHEIIIEFFNNWHTTGFYTSFTQGAISTTETAAEFFAPIMSSNPTLVFVGSYGSTDLYRNIDIDLVSSSSPIILFLSSYDAVNWNIINPNNLEIAAIGYGAWSARPTVTTNQAIPTIEVEELDYAYDNAIADIVALTGEEPDHSFGESASATVTIDLE